MTKNTVSIAIVVAVMEAMGFQVKSVKKADDVVTADMDKIAIAAAKAAEAEADVKIHAALREGKTMVNTKQNEIECDLSVLTRHIAVMANAPTLAVGIHEANNLMAAPAAKLAVSHRGNRKNGGKAHYFAMAMLPSERGIIDKDGNIVFGLENGWVIRGGYRDYDPELSAALAAMNNRAARYEAYEKVADEVQGWRTVIAAKKAARRALYISRHAAFADLAKAKAEKAKAEKKLRQARIAARTAEASPATSMAKADEIRRRETAAMKKVLAAKKAVAKAQSVVDGISALVRDVDDNILMAYVSAETQGLGYWVHERGSAPTMSDVIAAFAGKIAA